MVRMCSRRTFWASLLPSHERRVNGPWDAHRRERMDRIDVDGLRIAYERAGNGPALVLVHGYVGDGRATWHHQIDALSDEFTVVAWDAPGAGGSSDPPESFGIAGYADCLALFVEELGHGQAHVAGLSFGGALALELYHRHPAVAKTLTLASAYAGWAGSLPPTVADARLQQALKLSELSPDEFVETLLPTMFATSPSPEDVKAFRAAMLSFHPVGFRAMARASFEDLRDVPPTVAVPTLLLYGDNDERAPLTVAEALGSAITTSRIVVLPGVGHVTSVEAPEQFNREVRAFLTDHDD
jgi:pimeloyl-ACP methyl ester carboxylesterase